MRKIQRPEYSVREDRFGPRRKLDGCLKTEAIPWLELRANDQLTKGVIASGGRIVDKVPAVEYQLCREALKKCVRKSNPPSSKARALFPLIQRR